jgi:hypothetical protein
MTTIWKMAFDLILSKSQWTSGEAVTVWENSTTKITVECKSTNQGELALVLRNGTGGPIEVQAGRLSPKDGWVFSLLDRYAYADWVRRCGGEVDVSKQVYDELVQVARKSNDISTLLKVGAELNAHPITQARIAKQHKNDVELGELPPCDDLDLLAEWEEHHAQRVSH